LTLAVALPAAAAEAPHDPDARARAITPYLDPEVVAVGHVDLTRVNLDALVNRLAAIGQVEARELLPDKFDLRRWLADFTKAGGKELYAFLNPADVPQTVCYVIVPLEAGADARAIAGLLGSGKPDGPTSRTGQGANPSPFDTEVCEQLGGAVFGGSKAQLERLRKLQPQPRPELTPAFAAAGDSAVQVLVLPTADNRRVMEEVMPTLPKEVGSVPMTVFTHGCRWAALGADGPPKTSVRLVVQSQDAAAAKALAGLVTVITTVLGQSPDVKEALPNYVKVARLLTPKVEGDRLVVALNDTDLETVLGPALVRLRGAADRMHSTENLYKLGAALHDYHSAYREFPAAASYDKQNKPLLSWRVHVLPFLGAEEMKLYKEFHLDEPWDSEHNKALIARMPKVYRGANEQLANAGKTTYLAPVGEATIFPPGPKGVRITDITDGTSNTILLVDADDEKAVVWTRPEDLKVDLKKPKTGLGGRFDGGFVVLMADGSAHFLPKTVVAATIEALFTRAGGEVVDLP
jgi:hypothetical protein